MAHIVVPVILPVLLPVLLPPGMRDRLTMGRIGMVLLPATGTVRFGVLLRILAVRAPLAAATRLVWAFRGPAVHTAGMLLAPARLIIIHDITSCLVWSYVGWYLRHSFVVSWATRRRDFASVA